MLIEWNDSLLVGFEPMDDEHTSLVALINALHAKLRAGGDRATVETSLFALADHVASHFLHENNLMATSGYPEREQHLLDHRVLIDQFDTLLDHFDLLTGDEITTALDFADRWFIDHVKTHDAKLGEFLRARAAAEAQ